MEREKKWKPGSATGQYLGKKLKLSPKTIKLSIGDTVIVADKQKLINISPFFDSLFRFHADLETVPLLPPENADLDSFLAMLNSLINTRAKLDISAGNLWDCIVLSKYFQVEHIEDACWTAFREMLPTLSMDELLRLWRNGHACGVDKTTTLALVGISFKIEEASESTEFLDLSGDELVVLMSDEGFLPLKEESVCKAVVAWCLYDPEEQKNAEVLKRVLAEVVWDQHNKHLIQSRLPRCQEPDQMPKRTVISDDHKFPDDGLLKEIEASAGIIIGKFLYYLWSDSRYGYDYSYHFRSFCRMDMNNREDKEELDGISLEELKLDFKDGPDAESGLTIGLCLVRLAGGDKIGCFGSYLQSHHHNIMNDHVFNVANILVLYDITTNKWVDLPCLPLPRTGCAMIQCGSFLYLIGGTEHKALDKDGDNAQHCIRLDLNKFTTTGDAYWERIADLNAPRTDHKVRIQYGRIIVFEGQTRTKVAAGWWRSRVRLGYEEARWSEAYDPTLNSWSVLNSAA